MASGAGILLSLASVGLKELSACALCYRQSESSAWDWPRADNDYCSIGRFLACYSHGMLVALNCVHPPSLSCMTSEGLLWLLCSATEGCPEACIWTDNVEGHSRIIFFCTEVNMLTVRSRDRSIAASISLKDVRACVLMTPGPVTIAASGYIPLIDCVVVNIGAWTLLVNGVAF